MTISNDRPFGHYLREKRKALGLSQAELSERTKIQRTSISRLESDSGNPQWSMIKRIAEEGLGITVSELFQVEPIEVGIPIINVEGRTPSNLRSAEYLIKTSGWAVPILKSDTPLRSKLIEEKHVAGYFVIDQAIVPEVKDRKTVIWPLEKKTGGARFCLVDIEDTEPRDLQTYLVDRDSIELKKVFLTPKGAILLEPFFDEQSKREVLWGRSKENANILGRVVFMCIDCDTL